MMGPRLVLAAILLAHLQPAAARKKKASFCDTFAPFPAEARRHLPKVGKAVAREVCAYLGAAPAPRRLSLDRWTDDVAAQLGPTVELIEKALRGAGVTVHQQGPGVVNGPPWVQMQVRTTSGFAAAASTWKNPRSKRRLTGGRWCVGLLVAAQHWIQAISIETEAFELRALSAPILEVRTPPALRHHPPSHPAPAMRCPFRFDRSAET